MSKVIGIDLGTTNSVVAVMEGGEPTVITNQEGSRLTPSVVGFSKNGERLVGQLAKRQAVSNTDRTISSIKRHMGTDYKVAIDDKKYSPEEISAMILQKLKEDAEKALFEAASKASKASLAAWEANDYAAVVAVPATLVPAINKFFEDVMVMDKDEAIKANRLQLVRLAYSVMAIIGDISALK